MNAGRVELDLVAVGKDQVSAMLRTIDAQARKTADGLKKTGESAEQASAKVSTIGQVSALQDAAGPVNKLREAFENLRGNAGFVFGAITAAAGLFGAAIEGLTGDMFKGSLAMQDWAKAREGFAEGLKKTTEIAAGLRAELDKLQGKEANTLDIKTDEANERLLEINKQITAGEAATREWRKTLEYLQFSPAFVAASDSLAASQRKHNAELVELKKQQLTLNNLNLEAERERTIEAMRALGPLLAYLRGTKAAAKDTLTDADLRVDPTLVPGYVAPGKDKPRSGGGRRAPDPNAGKSLRELLWGGANEGRDDLSKVLEGLETDKAPIDAWSERMAERASETAKLLAEMGKGGNSLKTIASDADLVAAAFNKIAESSQSLEAVLPGLSGAFGQIAAIWDATDGSAKSMAQGVLGSVDAIANAGAAWIKDEKARTRFLGAKELLLAAPLWFIDPAQAAVRTATGIGLLALGGGGGGGAGGGARGSSGGSAGYVPDSRSGGGASTVVHHWSTFVSDPHTVQRMLATSSRATARTGLDTRNAA